jgi:phosphate transport system permease protein
MNSPVPSRRNAASDARLRKRYAAERRFRFAGLFAVGLSVLFLAILLLTMAWKGLGGFTRFEAAIAIDFPRSDVMLDPAALKGPEANDTVAGADLQGLLSKAATSAYGEPAAEMFGAAAARSLGRQLLEDSGLERYRRRRQAGQ